MADNLNLEAERAAWEAWAISARMAYRDDRHGVCFYNAGTKPASWDAWKARASSPVAVPEGALPPLPWEDRESQYETAEFSTIERMAAEIAEWRARAAVAADRAQQGEPVACRGCDPAEGYCRACREAERAATKASAPADAPSGKPLNWYRIRKTVEALYDTAKQGRGAPDLRTRIRMIVVDFASGAAPVPDTGIPTAGEVLTDERIIELWHDAGCRVSVGTREMKFAFARAVEAELASRCRAQGGITKDNDNSRAPVSSTPTSGAVEKAESIMDRLRRNNPAFAAHLDRTSEIVATWPAWKRVLWAAPSHPSEAPTCTCPSGDGSLRWPCPVHPSEAKAGNACAHCNRLPGERRDECEHCPVGAKAGEDA